MYCKKSFILDQFFIHNQVFICQIQAILIKIIVLIKPLLSFVIIYFDIFMLLSDITLSQEKQITVLLNGKSAVSFQFSYSPPLTISNLNRTIEYNWGIKVKRLRIFNKEGVEFYPEDLKYLRDKEKLSVSLKGEDFDVDSSYGEYQVIRELGEGGFGRVFLANHQVTHEPVAIKLMKSGTFNEAAQIDTVFAEAENLKALSHPNIVKIINCYALREMQIVVIMELMEGGELLDYLLEKGKFTEHQARVFFKQMISAVSYCHSKNIVHRDLKLENILLKEKGSTNIKIADFGISGATKQFNSHANTGTLKYMSPQILLGVEKGTTTGVDVWSLGVILYFMVTGKLPFCGQSSSQTIKLISLGEIAYPPQISISQQLKDLVSKLLQKNPKYRIRINDVNDHEWMKFSSQPRVLCSQKQIYNIPKVKGKKQRESIDFASQKRLQRGQNCGGGAVRSSISIPKRLQKQKGNIARELLKYGKVGVANYRSQMGKKLVLRKGILGEDLRFRKCLIQ